MTEKRKLRLTNEKYDARLKDRNPTVRRLEDVAGVKTPILHLFTECGHSHKVTPASMSAGQGCRQCRYVKVSEALKTSQPDYDKKLKKIHPSIIRLGDYTRARDRTEHRCENCGFEWHPQPANLLAGHGCLHCATVWGAAERTYTSAEYDGIIKSLGVSAIRLGSYTGDAVPLEHKCLACSHEWRVRPSDVKQARGNCPKCSRKNKIAVLPNGEERLVQGYEPQAIHYLIDRLGLKSEQILTSKDGGVPRIDYFLDQPRKFYPDIYLPDMKTIVEVKGIDTFGLGKAIYDKSSADVFKKNQRKCKAAKKAGFKCVFLVMTRSGARISIPKRWENMPRLEVASFVEKHCN